MASKLAVLCFIAMVMLCCGCEPDARTLYHQGSTLLQGGNYGEALAKFEQGLVKQPDSKVLTYGKARALYGLGRYTDALPVFEAFLAATDGERALYKDERTDAEFCRDKCKIELGMEVPQDPSAVPEEKMRY